MIKHNQARPNPKRHKILRENPKFYGKDGLKDLRYFMKLTFQITVRPRGTLLSVPKINSVSQNSVS